MRWAAIALSAAGILAIAGAILVTREHFIPQPETATGTAASPEEETVPSRPAEMTEVIRARPVAPEIVAQPQVAPEELQRVEPRAVLSPFAQPMRHRPKNHGRVYRPMIAAAGEVTGSGLTVTIAGVEVTAPDETCVDAEGQRWPCGVRARTAFRAFVRGRALACELPEEITEKRYIVPCTLGKQDVGTWLVAQGWAKALPGGPYEEAGEAARAAGVGIFGAAPAAEPLQIEPAVEVVPPAGTSPDVE